jgi:hypothetical protein
MTSVAVMLRMYPSKQNVADDLSELIKVGYKWNTENTATALGRNDFAYYPGAYGAHADEQFYLAVRMNLLGIAAQAQGLDEFDPNVTSPKALTEFDRLLYAQILSILPISLYEASKDVAWAYITVRVVPDIANWRYPNRKSDTAYDRHSGTPRDVFRRIWTRVYFSKESAGLLQGIGDDQAVAIFERTSIVSNPKLAMAALKALVFVRKISTENLIYRDAMKRVRRMAAIESLDSLPQERLDELCLAAFIQSLAEISPSSVVELSGEKA